MILLEDIMIFISLFIIGNSIALISTSVTAAVANHAPLDRRGELLGMTSSLRFLTGGLVGLFGGALASISPTAPLYAAIVACLAFTSIMTKTSFLQRKHA